MKKLLSLLLMVLMLLGYYNPVVGSVSGLVDALLSGNMSAVLRCCGVLRRQRIRAEQECDQLGQTQNAEHHAQRIRPKHFDAAFEVFEQRIDAADDRVVNAHGNHHRAAAYAGNDVGQTNNHAAQNVKKRFHAFLHLKFRIDRGILPEKDCLYIKTVRCSFGGRVLRNIFFAIVSASTVFVNRFFENLTFAWRVCRSAQNIDVFASG